MNEPRRTRPVAHSNVNRVTYDARGRYHAEDVGRADGSNQFGVVPQIPKQRSSQAMRVARSNEELQARQRRVRDERTRRYDDMRTERAQASRGARESSVRAAGESSYRRAERVRRNALGDDGRMNGPFDAEIVTKGLVAGRTRSIGRTVLIALLIAAVLAAGAFFLIRWGCTGARSYEMKETPIEQVTFSPDPLLLDGVPGGKLISAFSLTTNPFDGITQEEEDAIRAALDKVEQAGADVGFVLYSLETGFGISYNAGVQPYGASSIKALYAAYMGEEVIDGQGVDIDSEVTAKQVLDASDGYEVGGTYKIRKLIEDMIVRSSNNAFVVARQSLDQYGWDEWVRKLGAADLVRDPTYNFSWFSPTSACRVWTEMYVYLNSPQETEVIKELKLVLSQSQMSFIRAVVQTKGASSWTKAGWLADDTDASWNSIADSGIVTMNGHSMVMSVMSSLPYSEDNKNLLEDVIEAVYAVSGKLFPPVADTE